jgi:hypothetical protein
MGVSFPSWITAAAAWDEDVIYLLDAELRFADCNPAWDEFAARNGGRGISREEILGRLVLDFVPDVLRTFYVHKYWYAQHQEEWMELDYHCSSPEKIRLFRMGMKAVAKELLVVNHLLLEEECEVGPALSEVRDLYITRGQFATMCANCRKTKRCDDTGTWDWVPAMLQEHDLKISHGLCPRCAVDLYG